MKLSSKLHDRTAMCKDVSGGHWNSCLRGGNKSWLSLLSFNRVLFCILVLWRKKCWFSIWLSLKKVAAVSGSCCQLHPLGSMLQAVPGFWKCLEVKDRMMQSPIQVHFSWVRLYAPVLKFLHSAMSPGLLQGRSLRQLSECCFVGTDRSVYTCGGNGEVLTSKMKSWQQTENCISLSLYNMYKN